MKTFIFHNFITSIQGKAHTAKTDWAPIVSKNSINKITIVNVHIRKLIIVSLNQTNA